MTPLFYRLVADLRLGIAFLTRLPLPAAGLDAALAPVLWTLPVVGALVGGLGALAFWLATLLGLPAPVAAALTLGILLLVTGCFHEDGLADTADGLGGGWTRERKLEIMRDSRIGSYGAAALIVALLLRWAALAALATPGQVAWALLASEAASRALPPLAMALLPLARSQGLSVAAGAPSVPGVAVALLLGFAALLLGLGFGGGLLALLPLLVVTGLWCWLGMRQIGGYTGDTLGALQQLAAIAVLLAAVATR